MSIKSATKDNKLYDILKTHVPSPNITCKNIQEETSPKLAKVNRKRSSNALKKDLIKQTSLDIFFKKPKFEETSGVKKFCNENCVNKHKEIDEDDVTK